MQRELVNDPNQVIEKLKTYKGEFPTHCRYCEGTDPEKNNEFFNKRLFIGDYAIWIEPSVETTTIKAAIEKEGYISYAEQRVPDGFGRNYDSIYYALEGHIPTGYEPLKKN